MKNGLGVSLGMGALLVLSLHVLICFPEEVSAYTPRGPIVIDGNADFTPANGVSGGSGTWDDPFIIDGWEIDDPQNESIWIKNTSAHVIVRNSYIHSGMSNPYGGIQIRYSSNVTVTNCLLVDNQVPLRLDRGRNHTVVGNNISFNMYGMSIYFAEEVVVSNNTFWNTGISIGTDRHKAIESIGITPDNMVNGKPVLYLVNQSGLNIKGVNVGQLLLANVTDSVVEDLTIDHTNIAIWGRGLHNVSFSNLDLSNNSVGLGTGHCFNEWRYCDDNVTVSDSHFTDNSLWGLKFSFTNDSSIFRNTVERNFVGIRAIVVKNITISDNDLSRNYYGVSLSDSLFDVRVKDNNINRNTHGMYVSASSLAFCNNSYVFHNMFLDNTQQASDEVHLQTISCVQWDNGYPSGGNYWSDYVGPDDYSGPAQDEPGPDGIGDTPYMLDPDSRDRYPLVNPRTHLLSTLMVGQPNITLDRTFVTSSTPLTIVAVNLSGGEVSYTQYRTDGGAWNLYSGAFNLKGEGIHLLEYRSSDPFGRLEPIRKDFLVVDDTPPVSQIAVGQPSYVDDDLWIRSSTPLTLSATEPRGNLSLSGRVENIAVNSEPIGENEPYEDYLARSNHTVTRYVWPGLISVTFHVSGVLCMDVDLGVFLDANGDREPQSTELVAFDADTDADETVVIQDPSSGIYIVVVAGYNVPPAGCLADVEVIQTFRGSTSSGLDGIRYHIWNGSAFSDWTEYTDNFTIRDEGLAYVEHSAYDNLANEETRHNLTLYVDDTPPESEAESFDRADGGYDVQLTFQDSGCGVASTHYRLDGNTWQDSNLSEISLTLTTPGIHTIEFYAVDNLGNVEVIDSLVLEITAPAEPNWKPLVALIFTLILIAVGFLRSQKRPIPFGDSRRRKLKTFILLSGPFVIAEALTGLVSLILGVPSIPPLIGWGTALDLALLLCGVIVAIAFLRRGSEGVFVEREQNLGEG